MVGEGNEKGMVGGVRSTCKWRIRTSYRDSY